MIDIIANLDSKLFLYLNGLGTETFDSFWLVVTNKWASVPMYMLALYLIYREHGIKGAFIILVTVAFMIATTDQLSNLFKDGFQRPRPCQVESYKDIMRMVAVRCGKYGFFSAHAASTVAVSVYLSKLLCNRYTITPYLLLTWCALVSYSRIYLGVHYPTDIIVGGIVGLSVGFIYYKLLCFAYYKLMKHKVATGKSRLRSESI